MNHKSKKKAQAPVTDGISFDPGCLIQFTDTVNHAPSGLNHVQTAGNHRKRPPRRSSRSKPASAVDQERWRLGELESFLTNCLNLAEGIESKPMSKVVQQLRDLRSQVQQLRG